MPIVRKIIDVGTSKAVTLPKGWLEYLQKQTGVEITQVAIEVNRVLKIEPILPQKTQEAATNGGS
jgi:antitoxin component of MazEF toxin-antitoxin module